MNKRCIHISNCTEGQILAKDVVNHSGVKLAAKYTVINEYIKKSLDELGIAYVWIIDSQVEANEGPEEAFYKNIKESYMENVLTVKEILHDFASGRRIDYDKVAEISGSIYEEVNSTHLIIKCISELKNFDEYTYIHSINVSVYAMLIAKWKGLSRNDIKKAIQAGLLHDIGKMKIPVDILNKKEKLSAEEFQRIKKHPVLGYEVIKMDNCIEPDIQEAVLMHHERMDGTGYPIGITGGALNLFSKIVAIADVYDAMISDRIYKRKVTPFDAFEMFMTEGFSKFDINLLNVFLNNIPTYYIGANVVLNNGENGEIAYIPPQDIVRPIIKLHTDYVELSRTNNLRIKDIV